MWQVSYYYTVWGFPGCSVVKNLPGDSASIPEMGRLGLSLESAPWSVSERPGCPGSGLASRQWAPSFPSFPGCALFWWSPPYRPDVATALLSPPRDVSVFSPTPLLQALPPTPGATVQSPRYHLQNQGHSDPTLVIVNTWLSLCARILLGTLHILHHLILTFNHLILTTFNHLILTRASLVAQPEESSCSAEAAGDTGLIPGLERSPGGGHGNLLQDFCLENPHA